MPIINPTRLSFVVSPQHGTLAEDGTPLVAGYRLDTVGAEPASASIDLGLLEPDAEGVVDLALPPITFGGPYVSQVVAYNAAGEAASQASDTFGFVAPVPIGSGRTHRQRRWEQPDPDDPDRCECVVR